MQEQVTEKFDTWAVLELFGHQRLAGRVQEQSIGGASFVRVDVPKNQTEFAYTRYYNPSAIYSISPVPEEIARAVAKKIDNPPVYKWEIEQPALTAPADHAEDPEESEEIPTPETYECACDQCQCCGEVNPVGEVCDNCQEGAHQG